MHFAKRILQMDTEILRQTLALAAQKEVISFAGGLPAPESFPVEAMRQATDEVYRTQGRAALQYGPSSGYLPLREKLAQRLTGQGISCTAENILIVSGSQQGLDLAGKVFLEPGDLVVCENPTYLAALTVFRSYECGLLPIETDDDGMVPEDLERQLAAHPKVRLMYIIPSFQNPTGRTWSLERRKQILKIARRYELPILEDNPYGELRYEGETVPTLKSMDATGIVTYMGSFSKVLSPGIRLGWLLAERGLIEKYESAKECADLQASTLTQMVVDTYLEHNDLDANIRRLNDLYRGRRDRTLALLASEFPEGSRWTHPCGGLFLWVTMPEGIDTDALLPTMAAHKAAYIPGRTFFADGNERRCLRLNYSNASEEDMTRGMTIMGQVFRDALAKG